MGNHFTPSQPLLDTVTHGDCIEVMRRMRAGSVDFILTDPPYLVNYRDRSGRSIRNDVDETWLGPAFMQAHRVLKRDRFCVSFYGWSKIDRFMAAWRAAGFRPVGHLVFRKRYASTTRFLRYQHEQAFLLAKGNPERPRQTIPDVIEMPYSGNRLHPTQKAVSALLPLVESFSSTGGTVLDPFCGSGSTLVAARELGRHFLGIELDAHYHTVSVERLQACSSH